MSPLFLEAFKESYMMAGWGLQKEYAWAVAWDDTNILF